MGRRYLSFTPHSVSPCFTRYAVRRSTGVQPFIFGITDETHSMLTCMTTYSASYCEAMQFFSKLVNLEE